MRRRQFTALLGAAAAAWPLASRAQQAERMRRIGVLQGSTDTDDPRSRRNVTAFLQSLQQLGWTDGRNVKVDYRWPAGDADKAREYAAELVTLAPDVIVAISSASLAPLLQATRTVPLVFVAVVDPVGAGLVDSMSRPSGNATGFVLFDYSLSKKWLELLKEIAPGVKRVAILRDSALASGIGQFAVIEYVAPSLGIDVTPIDSWTGFYVGGNIGGVWGNTDPGFIAGCPPSVGAGTFQGGVIPNLPSATCFAPSSPPLFTQVGTQPFHNHGWEGGGQIGFITSINGRCSALKRTCNPFGPRAHKP